MKTKESQWFTHEVGTYNTPQMLELIEQYGMAGYGNWWILMEILRMEDGYRYDVSKSYSYNTFALAFRSSKEEVKIFIDDCIHKFDLLQTDGEYIWSSSLLERMQHLEKKKEFYKERGSRGGKATKANIAAKKQLESSSTALDEQLSSSSTVVDEQLEDSSIAVNRQLEAAHNITLHNTTKHNNDEEVKPSPSSSTLFCRDLLLPLETLYQSVLQDQVHFIDPICMQYGIDTPRLKLWLDAFNAEMNTTANNRKTVQDYRRHFINWLRYRDVATGDTTNWKEPPRSKKAAYTTASPPANPTIDELRAMRAAEEAKYLNRPDTDDDEQ